MPTELSSPGPQPLDLPSASGPPADGPPTRTWRHGRSPVSQKIEALPPGHTLVFTTRPGEPEGEQDRARVRSFASNLGKSAGRVYWTRRTGENEITVGRTS